MKWLNATLLILLTAPGAAAQEASVSQPGSVSGRITIEGDPAAGVTVRLPLSANVPNHSRPMTGVTDSEGRYRIEGVTPGQYFVAPFKPGFVGPNYGWGYAGKHVTIASGEQVENVDVELTKGAVMSGRITGEDGRPVVQTMVSLQRVKDDGTKEAAFTPFWRALLTDDRGMYRIFGLPAGKYIVGVGAGSFAGTTTRVAKTFHPRATEVEEATVVTVAAGAEVLGVDIAVGGKGAIHTASGVVVDEETGAPIGNAMIFAQLEKGDDAKPEENTFVEPATTNTRGEFRLNNLAEGRYTARVQQLDMIGTAEGWYSDPLPFTVDGDVTGLQIRARQGGAISGVVVVEGTADPAVLEKLSTLSIIARRPANTGNNPLSDGGGFTRVGADGSFQLSGLPPGDFNLDIIATGGLTEFRQRRIEVNNAPVSAVSVAQGERLAGVRIVVGYGSGTVRGQITYSGGSVPQGYSVSVALIEEGQPEDEKPGASWAGPPSTRLDDRNRFLVERVAPGTYEIRVSAIAGARGTAVQLNKGARPRVTVTSGQVSEVNVRIDLEGVDFSTGGSGGDE